MDNRENGLQGLQGLDTDEGEVDELDLELVIERAKHTRVLQACHADAAPDAASS